MFAIAASSFSRPSETFIRDHARTISPAKTVLISHERTPPELKQFPSLSGIDMGAWPKEPSGADRFAKMALRYWRRYGRPVLPTDDIRRTVEFLKQHKPTALMAEYGPTGVMLIEAAEASGVPLFVHFHGFDAAVMRRLPFWPMHYRRLFKASAGVIAPSNFVSEILRTLGCPAEKVSVCACGIDPTRFTATARLPLRLVAVGRLVEKKAPHITIEAFSRSARRFPDARLDIIGDGPLTDKCHSLIRKLGLSDQVTLHGRQSHDFVSDLMKQGSIFVQHSVTSFFGDVEGLPVSVLEAMASSLPVVSTRHSGIQEAVEHGVTGLLVDERDVGAMAAAIEELLQNPARAAKMGEAGRRRVLENYTQEKSSQTLRRIMGL